MKTFNTNNRNYSRLLRKNMTPHERKLWFCFLKKRNPRFKRQQLIDKYIVDFYCPKIKLVIELDGGGHYDLYENNQQDKERDEKLLSLGFDIIRIPNNEIDNRFEEVCEHIYDEINKRL